MKKVLLSTTALVAAGMMAGAAQAQEEMMEEPISLSLGGYYRAAIGTTSGNDGPGQPEANRHSTGIAQDAEVLISGETTLDNGLTVGVRAHMEVIDSAGIGGGSTVDEAWLYFRDDFGTLRLGSVESARQEMTNLAPNGASNFGVNTPFFTFASGSAIATYNDGIGEEDSAKLVYFSPTFNGLRVALSWAPDDNAGGQQYGNNCSNGATTALGDCPGGGGPPEYQNQIAVGMEYSQSFMEGSSVRVAGGYETYEQEDSAANPCTDSATNNCEPNSLHLGTTVSFGQVSFGGGWMKKEGVTLPAPYGGNAEQTIYDLGLSWSEGPMTVGIQWGHHEWSYAVRIPDNELDRYALNGTYVLGPGIDLQAQIDTGENTDNGNDWTQFMVGTAISF